MSENTINKTTLSRLNNNNKEFIYPKTLDELVEVDNDINLNIKLNQINNSIRNIPSRVNEINNKLSLLLQIIDNLEEYQNPTIDTLQEIINDIERISQSVRENGVNIPETATLEERKDLVYEVGRSMLTLMISGDSNIEELVIPDDVTQMQSGTFSNCTNLKRVVLPNNITNISDRAFYYSGLEEIIIPDSVTSIGSRAFQSTKLTEIVIPDSVKTLGYACLGWSPLTSVTLGNNLKEIGSDCFYACKLTKVDIPDSVEYIGSDAFGCMETLVEVNISPNSNLRILDGAAFRSTKIKSFYFPSKLEEIRTSSYGGVLSGCYDLEEINDLINTKLTVIGSDLFYDCSLLDHLTIINNRYLKNIEKNLIHINRIPDGYERKLKRVNISNNVLLESIGEGAFSGNINLEEVNLSNNNLNSLTNSMFQSCILLNKLNISNNNITSIGDACFYKCKSLPSFVIPETVTSIGNSAFGYCEKIKEINIPDNVETLGNAAFYYCYDLERVIINNNKIKTIGNYTFEMCSSLTSVNIPSSVTSIGDRAFQYCYDLEYINIPDGVESIGANCFYECNSLEEIIIPDGVKTMGDPTRYYYYIYTIYRCDSLKRIKLPKECTNYGDYTIYYCRNLEELILPNDFNSNGLNIYNIYSDLLYTESNLSQWVNALKDRTGLSNYRITVNTTKLNNIYNKDNLLAIAVSKNWTIA